jgi:hypothetical protein
VDACPLCQLIGIIAADLVKYLSGNALSQRKEPVKAHDLKRIVLITHYGCAAYAERLQRKPDECLPTQMVSRPPYPHHVS